MPSEQPVLGRARAAAQPLGSVAQEPWAAGKLLCAWRSLLLFACVANEAGSFTLLWEMLSHRQGKLQNPANHPCFPVSGALVALGYNKLRAQDAGLRFLANASALLLH